MDVLSDIKALAVAKGEQVQAWKEEQGVIKTDYDELTAAVSVLSIGDLDKEIVKLTSLSGAEMPDEVKENLLGAVKSTEETISAVTSLGAKTFQDTDIVYCRALPVSGTDMQYCFSGCSFLYLVEPLSLDAVTNASYAFNDCSSLCAVSISGLASVTSMQYCFSNCSSLNSLTLPEGAMAAVMNMTQCFRGCSSLNSLTLPEGSMAAVTNMQYCFSNCSFLNSLTLPEGAMAAVMNMTQCFSNCSSLSSLTLPEGSMAAVTNMSQCFNNCSSLSSLTLPEGSLKKNLTAYLMLSGCSKLTKVENFTLEGVALTAASYTDTSAYKNAIDFRPPSSLVDFEYSGTLYRSGVTLKNCPNLTAKSLFSWAAALYDWETNSESLTTDDTSHVLYMTAAQQATLAAYEGDGTMTGQDAIDQATLYGWEINS